VAIEHQTRGNSGNRQAQWLDAQIPYYLTGMWGDASSALVAPDSL
jgi:hypothetical protein